MFHVELDTSNLDKWTDQLLREHTPVIAGIHNGVHYIQYLEYGGSKQAPHGMVRVSIPDITRVFVDAMLAMDYDMAARTGHLRTAIVDRVNLVADFGMGLIRDRTPIRTGNARRNWRVIEAEV